MLRRIIVLFAKLWGVELLDITYSDLLSHGAEIVRGNFWTEGLTLTHEWNVSKNGEASDYWRIEAFNDSKKALYSLTPGFFEWYVLAVKRNMMSTDADGVGCIVPTIICIDHRNRCIKLFEEWL